MNRRISTIILLFVIFIFSCSKDKDEILPTITIIAPTHLQQISGGDTIQVLATITDDQNIVHVSLSLRDDNDIPVLATVSRSPQNSGTKSYNLNAPYFFDDIHMASGQYDFAIKAFDGENTRTSYVTISFNENQKNREGIFVISNQGTSSNVYLLDNNYNGNFYQSINGDFIGAAVDSYNQQLIHASKTTGSIRAIDLNTKSDFWNIPVLGSPPTPFYSGFYFLDQNIFLGKRNGGIQGYDRNGNPNFSTGTNVNHFMESALVHNNLYYVIEEQPIAGGNINLVLYWMFSGSFVQQTAINSDVKGVFSQNSNSIILLANDASLNGKVIFYDIPSGGASSPFGISSVGEIDDCVEISNGIYLVAASGNIIIINVNDFSTLTYLSGVGAEKLWYDELTNELFASNGSTLNIYDYSSKALKGNYTHTEPIKEVLFWYNK